MAVGRGIELVSSEFEQKGTKLTKGERREGGIKRVFFGGVCPLRLEDEFE